MKSDRASHKYVSKKWVEALKNGIEGFRELSKIEQFRTANLILEVGSKGRAHSYYDGCSSIDHRELENLFGHHRKHGSRFNQINNRLNLFEIQSWCHKHRTTKAYKLSQKVQQLKDTYLSDIVEREEFLDLNGRRPRKVTGAISSKDMRGFTAKAWKNLTVTTQVPVDVSGLCKLLAKIEKELKNCDDPQSEDFNKIVHKRQSCSLLIKTARGNIGMMDKIPHRYIQSGSGRLYATGTSLQNAPREARNAALHGFFDYDMENCHFSIFYQLAKRFGLDMKWISHYLDHKKLVRQKISKEAEITIEATKVCLLALIYGAKMSRHHECAIVKTVGLEKAKRLYNNKTFSGIAEAVKTGRQLIVNSYLDARGYKNAMGLYWKPRNIKNKEEIERKALSHIIQGIEAQALRVAAKMFGENILLLMHDGFVTAKPIDIQALEDEVFRETGFELYFSGKIIG